MHQTGRQIETKMRKSRNREKMRAWTKSLSKPSSSKNWHVALGLPSPLWASTRHYETSGDADHSLPAITFLGLILWSRNISFVQILTNLWQHSSYESWIPSPLPRKGRSTKCLSRYFWKEERREGGVICWHPPWVKHGGRTGNVLIQNAWGSSSPC